VARNASLTAALGAALKVSLTASLTASLRRSLIFTKFGRARFSRRQDGWLIFESLHWDRPRISAGEQD
jgi:hypothetical protein